MSDLGIPSTEKEFAEAKSAARYVIAKYTTGSCLASAVPIPGTDIVADLFCTVNMLEEICKIYGLSEGQIAKVDPKKRAIISEVIIKGGSLAVGKAITKDLVLAILKTMGKRMTAKQVTKYVPIIGQITSVAVAASIMWTVGEKQIRDCIKIAKEIGACLENQE